MKLYSFPVSLIRQYCFCPRIPWYYEYMSLRPATPLWVKQGESHHVKQTMLNRRRNLSRYGLENGRLIHDVHLSDAELGIHGVCDAIIETQDEDYPLEFKLYGQEPTRGQIFQLVAYGILCHRQRARAVTKSFMLYGSKGKTYEVRITPKLIGEVLETVSAMREMIESGYLPASPATAAQCGQCEYLNFCNDRD